MSQRATVTEIVNAAGEGGVRRADEILPLVYEELRVLAGRMMSDERRGHTLDATVLVHEAYLVLVDQDRVTWKGKTHFRAVAAIAMRRFLKEYARGRNAQKRGGGWRRVSLHEESAPAPLEADLVALEDALGELAEYGQRKVDIVELRYLGGLTNEEVSEALGISTRTVERDWRFAKAWLLSRLQ